MTRVDKQLPCETLEVLLKHKKEVLDNILAHYQAEMEDANTDSEKLFKYGFIFVTSVETATGAFAVAFSEQQDVLLFVVSVLFLTLAISSVLYERIRIEKINLRRRSYRERDPIMQQIVLLKGFLEPEEKGNA